jgi:AcrR family transcriptional regulator
MTELSPRERRHARTRQEILDAALGILNEVGPGKLSLREIARRVDYSPAGLYEYFSNKEEIIDAVCAEGDQRLQLYLRAVPTDLPADDFLIELGMAYIKFARENSDHFLLTATRLIPEMAPMPFEALEVGQTFGILMDAVQRGIHEGIIQPQPGYGLLEIAYSLWAFGQGIAILQLTNLKNVLFDYESADRAAMETFVRGLGSST